VISVVDAGLAGDLQPNVIAAEYNIIVVC